MKILKLAVITIVAMTLVGCAARTIHVVVTCECQQPAITPDCMMYDGPWIYDGEIKFDWNFDMEGCVEGPQGTWTCMTDTNAGEEDTE